MSRRLLPALLRRDLSAAAPTAPPQSRLDYVELRGLLFYGRHGVLEAERALGQRFSVDVRVGTCLRRAGRSDSLADTLDYAAVHALVRGCVEGPPRALVEAVAEDIAAGVLRAHPSARDVAVTLRKPHVAIAGVVDWLGEG